MKPACHHPHLSRVEAEQKVREHNAKHRNKVATRMCHCGYWIVERLSPQKVTR